jgi:hypothetical protein
MKKILLTFACFFFAASLANAHPPSTIDIKYDQAAKKVTAIIAHQVGNPRGHYIDKVTMAINQAVPELQRLFFQKTARDQVAVFDVPVLKPGDVIVIEAFCNKGGRLSQKARIK